MLQIDIVNSEGDNLIFEVNGHPNNGNSSVKKGSAVHWKVKPGSDVESIEDIKIKHIAGSSDIFSSHPPTPQNPNRTHWKGTVNAGARDYEVYVYKIVWKRIGENHPRVFDPIIAIKPTTLTSATSILTAAVAMCAAVGISYLLYGGKKWKKNKIW